MVNWIQQNADTIKYNTVDLDKQFDEFNCSLGSLDTFIENLRIQDDPKDYLMSMLNYGYSNGYFKQEAIETLKTIKWNGETEITSLTGIGQTNALSELVVWYFNSKN